MPAVENVQFIFIRVVPHWNVHSNNTFRYNKIASVGGEFLIDIGCGYILNLVVVYTEIGNTDTIRSTVTVCSGFAEGSAESNFGKV